MPVTELGFFRLKPDIPIDQHLKTNLQKAINACEEYTARNSNNTTSKFRFWHCLEDPNLMYYIGSWGSIDEHSNQFAPSPENKVLIEALGNLVFIEKYFHLDIDQSEIDTSVALGGEGLTVSRYFIKDGQRPSAEQAIAASQATETDAQYGEAHQPKSVIGGWRLDKDGSKQEYVVLAGMKTEGLVEISGDVLKLRNAIGELSTGIEESHEVCLVPESQAPKHMGAVPAADASILKQQTAPVVNGEIPAKAPVTGTNVQEKPLLGELDDD